jgi:hypothetical protein
MKEKKMADSQKTKSTPNQKSQEPAFNFPCGNFEKMFKMMQNFCGDGEGSFNCCEKMQQMCGGAPEKSEKKS